ncbi:MAG: hypothetical protein HC842_06520 [Cytophagales bacterium]|nr:hypothetical protein [Cytophagales bacterium]
MDLSVFIEEEILPALYFRLDSLLPEFELQHHRGHWQSHARNKLKTDGTEGSSGGSVYVYQNRPGVLKSFKASSPSRNLVSYIAQRQNVDWVEAVRYLAQFSGLEWLWLWYLPWHSSSGGGKWISPN